MPSLRALSEREGKQYYLPVGYNWNGFYYDKAVFEQYGLQPPTTWDEFLQVCETLWLNGVVPLSMSGEDPFMGSLWLDYLTLRLNGPDVHSQFVAGEIPFTDPRIRSVFEQWASLVEKGYFSDAAAGMGTQEALAAIVQKGNLLGPSQPWSCPVLPSWAGWRLSAAPSWAFFPFPVMDATRPPAEAVMSIGYMVPSAAPQRDAALDFTAYLTSAKGREVLTTDVVAGGLYVPAFAVADPAVLSEQVRQGMALVEGAQIVTAPFYMSAPPAFWPALYDMQRRILTEPGSSTGFDLDALLVKLEAAR